MRTRITWTMWMVDASGSLRNFGEWNPRVVQSYFGSPDSADSTETGFNPQTLNRNAWDVPQQQGNHSLGRSAGAASGSVERSRRLELTRTN